MTDEVRKFMLFLISYVETHRPNARQLGALLEVSKDLIHSWFAGRRYPSNIPSYYAALNDYLFDFDNKRVIRFKKKTGWTDAQIAAQFNTYHCGYRVNKEDVELWLSIGLPATRFTLPWKKSQGPKPKTHADFIKRRFVQMDDEVFSLRHVSHGGIWELETVEEFRARLKKGPQKGRLT